jgi:putative flippase GtrA
MRSKLNILLKKPTNNIYVQLFRHVFSGVIAFSLDVSVLYSLTEYAHIHYLTSAILGFCAGLIVTYLLSTNWVFNERRTANKALEFSVFVFISIVGLGFTWFFMWFFTSVLLFYYIVSKITTTVIVFVWNFVARRTILFTSNKN